MKQLIGSELEGFSEKMEYKDVDGKTKVEYARFERLVFRYKDARAMLMISFAALRIWNCLSDILIIYGRRGG
jgi:hypothetical protein